MFRTGIFRCFSVCLLAIVSVSLFEAMAAGQTDESPAAPQEASTKTVQPDEQDATAAHGEEEAEIHHGDPIAPVLIGVIVILLAAQIGGHFFESWGQPAVLGELAVGVLMGNLGLLGLPELDFLKVDYRQHHYIDVLDYRSMAGVTIDHLARLGVILLLFEVGLETSIAQMRRVGASAFAVAILGVIAPTALGWGCGLLLLPDHPWPVHMFLGATLCATSVGITARVLKDLNRSTTKESQIILGAAVIDDVLGLIVLAVAQGVIASLGAADGAGSAFNVSELMMIMLKASGFLLVAFVLGRFISRPLFKIASYLRGRGLLIVSALALCFLFSWAADFAGLATIVGAFAAGLILEDTHYRELVDEPGEHQLEEAIKPLTSVFVPIFFVKMGFDVDLTTFADGSILLLSAALIVAAIIGKQACSLGVLEKGVDRLSVGIGMIPRGEVGLIFAAIGLQLRMGDEPVVDSKIYSALVVMVIVTTLVTPPLLKWSFSRHETAET